MNMMDELEEIPLVRDQSSTVLGGIAVFGEK